MQRSDIPARLALPFANSGSKNTIPTAPSPTPGLASLELGFPPVTMTPIVAGGIPPSGMDFNGILYSISAASRWAMAGAMYTYNADFASAVGGYPAGAILLSASGTSFWLNLADNNETDPDDGGTDWMPVISNSASASTPGIIQLANSGQAAAGLSQTLGMTPFTTAGLFPFRGIQVYNAAGTYTWTVPDGVTRAWVTVVGGGGGGSYSGGGGGGTSMALVDITGVTSVPITVGAGGTFSSSASNNGGASSFGVFCSAGGGSGGPFAGGAADPNRAAGGSGTGGDVNLGGGPGQSANRGADGGGTALSQSVRGSTGSSTPAQNGQWPGGGGGGRADQGTPGGGGNGAAGAVIIKW